MRLLGLLTLSVGARSVTALARGRQAGRMASAKPKDSKICVVVRCGCSPPPPRTPMLLLATGRAQCNRPFEWRKKWERCWDEVTTCSKRCNSERKGAKRAQRAPQGSLEGVVGVDPETARLEEPLEPDEEKFFRRAANAERKQLKAERRAKREGRADASVGQKPCSVCTKDVDLLIRCKHPACWRHTLGDHAVVEDKRTPRYRRRDAGVEDGLRKVLEGCVRRRHGRRRQPPALQIRRPVEKPTRRLEEVAAGLFLLADWPGHRPI